MEIGHRYRQGMRRVRVKVDCSASQQKMLEEIALNRPWR
jgi:hypothetical protein